MPMRQARPVYRKFLLNKNGKRNIMIVPLPISLSLFVKPIFFPNAIDFLIDLLIKELRDNLLLFLFNSFNLFR